MIHYKKYLGVVLIFGLLLTINSCKEKPTLPVLTTDSVKEIAQTSALTGGNVTSDGGAEIIERGICWSTGQYPTISSNKKSNGTGTGTFTVTINSLYPNTSYHVRAYAINGEGTSYGNDVSFTTSQIAAASLTTVALTSVTANSAVSGGSIISDNGEQITAKGVCWSTNPNPTVSDFTSDGGTGTGAYTCQLTGLQSWTSYYVRAYATNSVGTGYGDELNFKTSAVPPVLSTKAVLNIAGQSATSGGVITSDGGLAITARGVCWSSSQNPKITNSFSSDNSGTGSYTSNITGLTLNTTYYIRAYATNESGTYYGTQFYFVSAVPGQVSDIDGNTYNTIPIGMDVIMKENLKTTKYNDGTDIPLVTSGTTWIALTGGAYCWYNNDESANKNTYGALYNWYAVNTKKLCPSGWHVPSKAELNAMIDYLNANGYNYTGAAGLGLIRIAKSLAAQPYWNTSTEVGAVGNTDFPEMINATGFSALPNGIRDDFGDFVGRGAYGSWWSSYEEPYINNLAWFLQMSYNQAFSNLAGSFEFLGEAVRCFKN
jgi:uncharacterized protein (TIGR02145 family)